MFVTEARLEQAAYVVINFDMKNMGSFLQWMVRDIEKESTDELEASELTWEQVQKNVMTRSRTWFKEKNSVI